MSPRVVVIGGGVAGLTTALSLARGGVQVDVLERDQAPAPFGRRGAASWVRDGVPQAQHAHVFGSRCYQLLSDELPDVLSMLLAAGAREIPLADSAPALAVRRPLFDWVLRRVAERQPGVRVHCGTAATGLRTDGARLSGVMVPGGVLPAVVAVDASGGVGRPRGWLADLGYTADTCATDVAGEQPSTTYFSRCYALRWHADPGELNLGAAAGGTFEGYRCHAVPGDNATVTVTFAVPTKSIELAVLRMPEGFQAAAEQVPPVGDWVDPGSADPLSGVCVLTDPTPLPNSAPHGSGALPGMVAVGDAAGVGDRLAGDGVRIAMAHGLACAAAIRAGQPDPGGLTEAVRAVEGAAGGVWPKPAPSAPSARELVRIAELAATGRLAGGPPALVSHSRRPVPASRPASGR